MLLYRAAPAPVVSAAPVQRGTGAPVALPRAGNGVGHEGGFSGSAAAALGLLIVAGATAGAALALRLRAARG